MGNSREVAIPRVTHAARAPSRKPPVTRDRVVKACWNCHKRKIKCSGEFPRCSLCEKTNKPCIYEANRKDRLTSAHDRIEHLVALLKDLGEKVHGDDRARIESVLNEATAPESELDFSSAPSTSGNSPLFRNVHYAQQHTDMRPQSHADTSRSSNPSSPGKLDTSQTLDENYVPSEYVSIDDTGCLINLTEQNIATQTSEVPDQICEAQWLASLKKRLQAPESSWLAVPALPIETNYYYEEDAAVLPDPGNPFELPEETVALHLCRCYFRTMHLMFPFVATHFEAQLLKYYQMARSGAYINITPIWYATVHLVFAIGARYLKISDDRCGPDSFDESICVSRAFRLMGFNGSTITLTPPDLNLVQSTGLLALYYLAAGHVKRAWVIAGTALRFAIAIGLHLQKQPASNEAEHTNTAIQIWWSISNLDTLLSSLVGRLCLLSSDDITTPLLSEIADDNYQPETLWSPTMAFLDVQIRISSLTQKIMSSLYNERRAPRPWSRMHASMTELMADLDTMGLDKQPQNTHPDPEKNRLSQFLQKQHVRLKILITRPSLRRIEHCAEIGIDDFTSFDHDAAASCIQTAQYAASLLPSDMDANALYDAGPWWMIVHFLTQPLAILLSALSLQAYFPALFPSSLTCAKKFVTWLRVLAPRNEIARRAFAVIKGIVQVPVQMGPSFWTDIAALFPEDDDEKETHGSGGA